MDQPEGSTLSKECFFAETDTECKLCTKPDCEHYCHTDSYKFWRATDTLVSYVLLMGIRQAVNGDADLVAQFPILKDIANDVAKAMDAVRNSGKAPDDRP
jgi:hypothetical protein